ncbi:MAG: hypothetical protein E5W99_14080, partial [Mesorhizobium sp.]
MGQPGGPRRYRAGCRKLFGGRERGRNRGWGRGSCHRQALRRPPDSTGSMKRSGAGSGSGSGRNSAMSRT